MINKDTGQIKTMNNSSSINDDNYKLDFRQINDENNE